MLLCGPILHAWRQSIDFPQFANYVKLVTREDAFFWFLTNGYYYYMFSARGRLVHCKGSNVIIENMVVFNVLAKVSVPILSFDFIHMRGSVFVRRQPKDFI